jgi:glycosyltransferase involved in cell wall biosynthesis
MALSIWHNPKDGTGRQHFASALMEAVVKCKMYESIGHVGINFVSGRTRPGFFNVLRVDGIYYDQPRLSNNSSIAKSILSHDLVVYQSNFSKHMAEKMLGVAARRSGVVFNGTRMAPVPLGPRLPVVVASARWRPNKRPRAIAEAFLMAKRELGIPHKLHMIGSIEEKYRIVNPAVVYRGDMSHDGMRSILAEASLMVHICHIDSCPNSVVEGLRMGVPVLCNNIGGTPELVDKSGFVADIDKPFDFMPIPDMKHVGDRSVDVDVLSGYIKEALSTTIYVDRPDLDIAFCADRYLQVIKDAMQS